MEQSHDYHMTSGGADSGLWSQSSSLPAEHQHHINFDRIIKNVKELNILAGEGSSEVTTTPKGAKLKVSLTVSLCIHRCTKRHKYIQMHALASLVVLATV